MAMLTALADSQIELGSPFNTCITIHQAALSCWAEWCLNNTHSKETYLIWDTWFGQKACFYFPVPTSVSLCKYY